MIRGHTAVYPASRLGYLSCVGFAALPQLADSHRIGKEVIDVIMIYAGETNNKVETNKNKLLILEKSIKERNQQYSYYFILFSLH